MEEVRERRSFYRINDLVGLRYRVIDKNIPKVPNDSLASNDIAVPLSDVLAEIDHELNQLINTLWLENPIAAKALGLLNKKIDILTPREPETSPALDPSFETRMVNISGCGIAFACEQPFDKGVKLSLDIGLKPSNIYLNLSGSVVGCDHRKENSGAPFWLRVNFDEGNSATQEQLIQHIVQKQYSQIQAGKRG